MIKFSKSIFTLIVLFLSLACVLYIGDLIVRNQSILSLMGCSCVKTYETLSESDSCARDSLGCKLTVTKECKCINQTPCDGPEICHEMFLSYDGFGKRLICCMIFSSIVLSGIYIILVFLIPKVLESKKQDDQDGDSREDIENNRKLRNAREIINMLISLLARLDNQNNTSLGKLPDDISKLAEQIRNDTKTILAHQMKELAETISDLSGEKSGEDRKEEGEKNDK